jgi:diadenosine tetraphosphate (Ap4A) HIT family hydrolase
VLLCPTRVEKKYKNLTETECGELWISARNIAENLKKFYNTNSVQITIQDGEDAGM